MEKYSYARIELIASTDEQKIKLEKLIKTFKSLAYANGLSVESHEEDRFVQTKNVLETIL